MLNLQQKTADFFRTSEGAANFLSFILKKAAGAACSMRSNAPLGVERSDC